MAELSSFANRSLSSFSAAPIRRTSRELATEDILRVTLARIAGLPSVASEPPSRSPALRRPGRSERFRRRMAERVGFEPTCPFGQDAFEAPPLRPLRYLSVEVRRVKRTFDYTSAFPRFLGSADDCPPMVECGKRLHQKIDHTFERIEPERRGNRRPQVRVRVDVVKDPPPVVCFQILDHTYVEPGSPDNPLRRVHGILGHIGVRIKLYRGGFDLMV